MRGDWSACMFVPNSLCCKPPLSRQLQASGMVGGERYYYTICCPFDAMEYSRGKGGGYPNARGTPWPQERMGDPCPPLTVKGAPVPGANDMRECKERGGLWYWNAEAQQCLQLSPPAQPPPRLKPWEEPPTEKTGWWGRRSKGEKIAVAGGIAVLGLGVLISVPSKGRMLKRRDR